jgi:dihydroorotase
MSSRPAAIGRLSGHGGAIEVGAPANLTLVDPSGSWTVEPAALASKARNTPFAGHVLPAPVVGTLLRGRLTVRDGAVVEPVPA